MVLLTDDLVRCSFTTTIKMAFKSKLCIIEKIHLANAIPTQVLLLSWRNKTCSLGVFHPTVLGAFYPAAFDFKKKRLTSKIRMKFLHQRYF